MGKKAMRMIEYFKSEFGVGTPGEVTWSHAVNSNEKLDRILADPGIMMIESDIRVNNSGVAVAVHPPETESDLSFEELISKLKDSNKGFKADFKDPEILIICLKLLAESKLNQPVLLNADILQGNGANISKFSPAAFISLCQEHLPSAILSIGWTTVADPAYGYTSEQAEEMSRLSEQLVEVTYPVRACLLPNSWDNLLSLIQPEGRTLSIWNNEPVDDELRDFIRANTDPEKTFYDFIDDNKEPLKLW